MNSYPKNYHPADIAEIKRMISNLIRQGIIYEVKGDRVKVQSGEIITAWLPWFTHRAGKNKTWWQPSIGEQVFILSPNGNLELGSVLPSLYSDDNPAPSSSKDGYFVEFPDGASFEYEPESGTLNVTGIKTAVINASAGITAKGGTSINLDAQSITLKATKIDLKAPSVECEQMLTTKQLEATIAVTTQTLTASMGITANGAGVSSNGVSFDSHVHGGVESGNKTTGTPQ